MRVHHEGPVLGDGFAQRSAGDQDGARAFGASLQDNRIAARRVGQDRHALAPHQRIGNRQLAAVDMHEGVVRRRQRLLEAGAGLEVHVQIEHGRGLALHGTGHAMAAAGDHANDGAVALPLRHFVGRDVAVPGLAHLVARRQVEPELEALHRAVFLFGHFAVDDAAAGGHPLHAAGHQQADVADAVAVAHAALQHVGDGLEAAVRVAGKAADVVAGVVGAKGVEHQERVEPALQVLRQHARQAHAGAVAGGLALDQPFDAAWL